MQFASFGLASKPSPDESHQFADNFNLTNSKQESAGNTKPRGRL
ncbi:hypothetical protein SynA1560_02816 [Synechococcus sp. A15-60]|nr:hypothetical protein SynA1560_02816 [Synechococcus sp. A15-60]